MKLFYLLSIAIIFFVVSCSTDTHRKVATNSVKLKTSNKQLQLNFDNCLRLTQKLIKTQISDKEFKEYFSLNDRETGVEYDYIFRNISDSLFLLPKTYSICYDFVFNDDTLSSFTADFDSSSKIISYGNFHLIAFRQFIDKKLTITRAEAMTIALKNGMKREGLELMFKCSADKFYWECKNDCDSCLYLEIDANTGNIINQGKIVYQY